MKYKIVNEYLAKCLLIKLTLNAQTPGLDTETLRSQPQRCTDTGARHGLAQTPRLVSERLRPQD